MTAISLIAISFFVFWIWLLMDFVNQTGVEKARKERLITFHTFLGLIGIAFYFFLMISAYASNSIMIFDNISEGAYRVITGELRPALVIGFVIIVLFPVVAAGNLLLKKKYEAKKYLKVVNIVEGLAIVVVFIYILAVGSSVGEINESGPYPYLISDVIYGRAQYFGIDFEINPLSFTFSIVFYLFIATIIIWLFAAFHYLFIIKVPLRRKEIVMLNTEEIKKISEMGNIYRNALYFLVGFSIILLRDVWDYLTGFRISHWLLFVGKKIAGLDYDILHKLNPGVFKLIQTGEIFRTYAGKPREFYKTTDLTIEQIKTVVDNAAESSWFTVKSGFKLFKFVESFFAGNVGGVFSPSFVIGAILIIFALIVWLLLRHVNRELDNIQITHEVKMSAFRHAVYMNSFNAWRVSLFAAIATIVILNYFFRWPYFDCLKYLPSGIVVTFEVTIAAMIIALMLGMFAGLGKLSNNAVIKGIASVYVEVVRGVPLLVQLFYIHFGLGSILNFPPLVSAISAMSICYGAYLAETFRAGIQSISKGQIEAAKSLGMTNYQTMRQVLLPQAVKVILPPVGNDFIALLKDSSLVSIIAVADLLRRGREFTAVWFTAYQTYTLVALIYLVITLILSKVVWNMEKIMATD